MSDLIQTSDVINGDIKTHVIFIHGLGGDSLTTWHCSDGSNVFWPNWLAEDIDGLSVWTIGYDAAVSRWRGSAMHLTDRATNILERILLEPKLKIGEIVLIGHSLGGLVIKQLLRDAGTKSLQANESSDFINRVCKIAFLATPHSGSDHASLGDRLRLVIRPSAATSCLVRNNPNLLELNKWYRLWSNEKGFSHLILSETRSIKILGMIVKPDSSDPGLQSLPVPVDADHITICKPKDRKSEIYLHIKKFLEVKVKSKNTGGASKEQLKKLSDAINSLDVVQHGKQYPAEFIDQKIESKLLVIRKSRFIGGYSLYEPTIQLVECIKLGEYSSGSAKVKSIALAWCVRFLALTEHGEESDDILTYAKKLNSVPELVIAEAFRLSAKGLVDEALAKLAFMDSANSRSAVFLIRAKQHGAVDAIEWLSKSKIESSDLDSDGKLILIGRLIELERWDEALKCVEHLQEDDFQRTPALLHLSGITHLLITVPDEFKSLIIKQIPIELRSFPLASNKFSLDHRKVAQNFFLSFSNVAQDISCVEAANLADDYALWLELRNPKSHDQAIEKLKICMRDTSQSLRRVNFALKFGIKLDFDAVEKEIDRCTALTDGNSIDAAIARFSLMFMKKPKDVAEYIDRYQKQLEKHFGSLPIQSIKVEVLAKAGLVERAEKALEAIVTNGLSEQDSAHLKLIIGEAKGKNPIEDRKKQYLQSSKLNELNSLVDLLEVEEDWVQVCRFGKILFDKTQSLSDAKRLTQALYKTHNFCEIVKLLSTYPEFLEQSNVFQELWGWSLYYEGLFNDAEKALESYRETIDHQNARALTLNLAISKGNWESLFPIIEEAYSQKENRDAKELLQLAQLAQVIGSTRSKDIVRFVAENETKDAEILITAYAIATSGGWEDSNEVAKWLHDAAKISGENGPVKMMKLKDVIEQQPEWNRREDEAWQNLKIGKLPICAAANLLNKSLVEMFLFPILANSSLEDARHRVLVPAYSGVRQASVCNYKVIAMESTSLISLNALGLLDNVCEMYENIVVPHSTLRWLFEEKKKALFHQPSRIKKATEFRQMIAEDELKEFCVNSTVNVDLIAEIGEELASFITEASIIDEDDKRQKIVVRSSPVHSIGSLMEEEANLSSYSTCLCSCMAVVNKLKQKGQLTTSEENFARVYLRMHEVDWPDQPDIEDGAVLYLDDLSISYLQHTGLLRKIKLAGLETYISSEKINETNALLRYNQLASDVSDSIENIRIFLAKGIKNENILIGKVTDYEEEEQSRFQDQPTLAVMRLAKDVEAIVVDDRFINQHQNIDNGNGNGITPILTTLDLIDGLRNKKLISFEKWLSCRTELRRFGYLYVPVLKEELECYFTEARVSNEKIIETAELKAIRESILRIRMSDYLQLPKESTWLNNLFINLSQTLKAQWKHDIDQSASVARSKWLIHLLDPRGWAHCLEVGEGFSSPEPGYGSLIVALLLAPSDQPDEIKNNYHAWLDESLLNVIKEESPLLFSYIQNGVKSLVVQSINDEYSKG